MPADLESVSRANGSRGEWSNSPATAPAFEFAKHAELVWGNPLRAVRHPVSHATAWTVADGRFRKKPWAGRRNGCVLDAGGEAYQNVSQNLQNAHWIRHSVWPLRA